MNSDKTNNKQQENQIALEEKSTNLVGE